MTEKWINFARDYMPRSKLGMQEDLLEPFLLLAEDESDFPVDIDLLVEFGLDTKRGNAKARLLKTCRRENNYIIRKGPRPAAAAAVNGDELASNEGDTNSVPLTETSSKKEIIRLSVDCFKQMCLSSHSPTGQRVRDYFIEVEKCYRKFFTQGVPIATEQPSTAVVPSTAAVASLDFMSKTDYFNTVKDIAKLFQGVELDAMQQMMYTQGLCNVWTTLNAVDNGQCVVLDSSQQLGLTVSDVLREANQPCTEAALHAVGRIAKQLFIERYPGQVPKKRHQQVRNLSVPKVNYYDRKDWDLLRKARDMWLQQTAKTPKTTQMTLSF